jgi:membrane protease YdiL (CAAX protease family)
MPTKTAIEMTDATAIPRLRLGLLLWVAGMVGTAAVTTLLLSTLLAQVQEPLPAPLWAISLAGLAQSGLILALAVWGGLRLAPSVGLRAPACEAVVTGRPVGPALRLQFLSGLIGGVLGGVVMLAAFGFAPAAVVELQERFSIPIVARVVYGGLTEELLLRWGLMTALVWLAWRFLQHRRGPVRAGFVWLAIAVSALLFAAGHLPAASFLIGTLSIPVVVFVIGVNTTFGLLFGYLYWRHGLEAAMIAHAMAHLVSFVGTLLWQGAA